MLLREIMQVELVTARPESTVKEAAGKMKSQGVGCVLVTEDGGLTGILTDRDIACLLVAEGKDPETTLVSEIMHTEPTISSPDKDILEGSRLMAERNIRRLPLQSNGKLEGMVTMSELAPVLREETDNFFKLEEVYRH